MVAKVRAFVEWVDAGRALTQTGRLRRADALALVELLDTGDVLDQRFPTQSSAELYRLSLLVESDLPIELSLHVRPLASADMVRALGVQIARLQSSRLAALRGERVGDPEREIALEDAERLRERLQRGEERL